MDRDNFKIVKEDDGWDIEAVSRALGTEPEPHKDLYIGEGYRFILPELDAHVELYPERFAARYSHLGVYLEMANVRLEIDSGVRLIAETEKCRTVVSMFKPEGTIIFSGPREQPEPEEPKGEEPGRHHAKPSDGGGEAKESALRVTLTGNVGRDPEVRTTPKGRKVLKFPLGVHEGEKTNWHNILFFDDRAEKAARQLSKGNLVTIVGFKHEREAEVKKGNTTIKKKVVEIYGAAVQARKTPTTESSE